MSHARPRTGVLAPALEGVWRSGWAPGFLFWCAFLLALEPDNLLRAAMAGATPSWSGEIARITGAGLLGAAAAPLTLVLVRRWPVARAHPMRVLIHLGAAAGLAPVLVIVGHVLAAAFLGGAPCTAEAMARDLASNGALVAFCLLAFDAILHSARHLRQARPAAAPMASDPPAPQTTFRVRSRGGVAVIAAAEIDWVEAQGNYVGLHVGASCHLIRETLARFEARLDPVDFVRIHRGSIVALSRVRGLRLLPGGDAFGLLSGGQEIRVSRTYLGALKARL